MKKTIVILAKSIKHQHFCIAGKDLETRQWIRPVSNKDGGIITREQSKLTFQGAGYSWDSKILHNVEIYFLAHSPLYFQPENYVISEIPWQQRYKSSPDILFSLLDNPKDLWGNNSCKINRNDIRNPIEASLYLIYVNNLFLYWNEFGKRKVCFTYNNVRHENFSCTDPNFDELIRKNNQFSQAILCLSLGELFVQDNCHYKIVATIFI